MSIYIDENRNAAAVGSQRRLPILPDKPVYTTKAKKTALVNLMELWKCRELCYFFFWRDLKVRYRQTLLGVAWVIIQPSASMLIFTYIFGNVVKLSSNGIPYPVFYYSGLLLWIFFSNTINNCSNCLNNDRGLITKVYFPRMILPAAVVLSGVVDMLVALLLLVPPALYYGFMPTRQLLAVPFALLLAAIWTYSLGMISAALNLRYRDIKYALPFIVQLLFFATPVIFPLAMLPEKQRRIIMVLNPLSICIEELRAGIVGRSPNWSALLLGFVVAFITLCGCTYIFWRFEKTFAEKI